MTAIVLNGERTDVRDGATVSDVVERLDLPAGGRGVAVAVDAEVVPRTQWDRRVLDDGARVEILNAMQGG